MAWRGHQGCEGAVVEDLFAELEHSHGVLLPPSHTMAGPSLVRHACRIRAVNLDTQHRYRDQKGQTHNFESCFTYVLPGAFAPTESQSIVNHRTP